MQMENGAEMDQAKVSAISPSKAQETKFRTHLATARLGAAVTLMLGSPRHRALPLGQLRRSVIPAMVRGRMVLAEAGDEQSGKMAPAALILWANVSDETHERLQRDLDKPIQIDPEDWDSGENYWIVDAVGEERFVAQILTRLRKTAFAGRRVHYRIKNDAGREIATIEPAQN